MYMPKLGTINRLVKILLFNICSIMYCLFNLKLFYFLTFTQALESEVTSSAETEVRVVIEEKTTVRKTCDVWLEFFIVIISFISFWSIAFFFMEVTSFFVEMAMYTLMGIIVNESTLRYVTGEWKHSVTRWSVQMKNKIYNSYIHWSEQTSITQ